MKLTLAALFLTLSTSAFAANKVYKIKEIDENEKEITSTITISEKRFSTREEASKFCKSQKSELGSLYVAFHTEDQLTEAEADRYFGYDLKKLLKNKGYEDSGLMMWSEAEVFENEKTPDNKKVEIVMMTNGQGEDINVTTAKELNGFFKKLGAKNITLPAVCIK